MADIKSSQLYKRVGLGAIIILGSIVIWLIYGNIIASPNYVFFAPGGDGLKCTYGTYYHYQFDSSYSTTKCMNYPFGESIFFTDSHLIVGNGLKFLKQYGFDFSNNITGILNIWMILTLLIGLVCIYLVFIELKLPVIYSIGASFIVAFLSPQIERFSGHYNLAWLFIMPLLFLLLLKYYKKPNWIAALWCGITAFFAMCVHGYFYAFFGLWSIIMLAALFFIERDRFPAFKSFLHLVLMLGLPAVLFALITAQPISDRTAYPWGGIQSAAYIESVFVPGRLNYPGILSFGRNVSYYIGLISTTVFIILIVRLIKNKFSQNKKPKLIAHKGLQALLIASVFALLYSLVWPFKFRGNWPLEWSLEPLLNYLGPLRQFRGTGRFSWIFYYTINFIAFYIIWFWYKKSNGKYKVVILGLVLTFGAFEALLNVKNREREFNHTIAEIKDDKNQLSQNSWVDSIDVESFQVIMPIPYFHVGSETFWIDGGGGIERASFIASWKTGLPINAVMLSRTAFSHTLKNLQLIFEPLRSFDVIELYPNQKDILIVYAPKANVSTHEARIIEYAEKLSNHGDLSYYSLSLDSLQKLQKDFVLQLKDTVLDSSGVIVGANHGKEDSYILQSFGNDKPVQPEERTAKKVKIRKPTIVLDTLLFNDTKEVCISFWMSGMDKDLIARTRVDLRFIKDGNVRQMGNIELFRNVQYVNEEGWGLYETYYTPQADGERVVISLENSYATSQIVCVDEILIRKSDQNIKYVKDNFYFLNNRYFRVD